MTYKIHPSIGVARVGSSDEYYISPERAGDLPGLPSGQPFAPSDFRDEHRRLRRQGARFEVLIYDESDSKDGGRAVVVGQDRVIGIEWTVHLANKKASWYQFVVNKGENGYAPDHPLRNPAHVSSEERRKLIIDPGPRTLTGPGQTAHFSRSSNPDNYPMTFPPRGLQPHEIDTLGDLLTEADGRLVVLGGHGNSGSTVPPFIADYANNDEWWDDTSDGPVTATVVFDDGRRVEVQEPSWVIVAPPKYAPELLNLVTLWDTIFDTAVRTMGLRPDIFADSFWRPDFRPNWERDIRPILERAHLYPWVVASPPKPHSFDFEKLKDPRPDYDGLRAYYLTIIRPPDGQNILQSPINGYPMMPYLCGDNCFVPGPLLSNYLTLTATQYFFLQQWAAGHFDNVELPPMIERGENLDRAVLDCCVGGAFSPGIEMTWVCRNPRLYASPFRLRHKKDVVPPLSLGGDLAVGLEPGDVTRYMALPWQADFNECSQENIGDRYFWWWPVQRPSFVRIRPHKLHEEDVGLIQVPWVGTDRDQTALDYIQFPDDLMMVTHWKDLGFVFNEGTPEEPVFLEVERILRRRRTPHGTWEDVPSDL